MPLQEEIIRIGHAAVPVFTQDVSYELPPGGPHLINGDGAPIDIIAFRYVMIWAMPTGGDADLEIMESYIGDFTDEQVADTWAMSDGSPSSSSWMLNLSGRKYRFRATTTAGTPIVRLINIARFP